MECPVCFSVLEDESSSLTSCNHSLCITCLNKIIQEGNNKCPLCRSNIEGYFNKGEKTKIIFREANTHTPPLIPQTDRIINILKIKYYLLWIIFIGSLLTIVNEKYVNLILNDYVSDTLNKVNNITNQYNACKNTLDIYSDLTPSYIYNPNDNGLVFCDIPYYFINKCFSYVGLV